MKGILPNQGSRHRFVRPWMGLVLPMVLLVGPVIRGRGWFHEDIGHYFHGLRGLLHGAWTDGLSGWTPFVSCGMPFLGDVQLAPFYPPNLLFYFLDTPVALGLYFIFHFALGSWLTWRFLARLGCSAWGATFGTLVYLWNGFFWAHLHHVTFLAVGIWLPAMLEAWDRLLERGDEALWAWPRLAFVIAMATLAGGSPQILYYELLFLAAYAGFTIHTDRPGPVRGKGSVRILLAGTMGIVGGLGLAGVQLLPAALAAREKYRLVGDPVDYASTFALSPLALVRALVPNVFGNDFFPYAGQGYVGPSTYWESWCYMGVLTVPLAAMAMRARGRRGFFTWAGAFALLASLGKVGGLHWLLAWGLPFYARFRAPARWMMVVGFCLAVLSSLGVDRLAGCGRNKSTSSRGTGTVPTQAVLLRSALITLVVGVELWAVCALVIFLRDRPLHLVAPVGWLLALVNVLAAWLYLKRAARAVASDRKWPAGPWAVALLLLDLVPVLATYNRTVPLEEIHRVPTVVDVIRTRVGHDRVLADRSAPFYLLNGGNEFQYRGVRGYNPLNPGRLVRFLEAVDGSPPREGGISALVNRVTAPLLDVAAPRLLVTRKARSEPWLREIHADPVRQLRVYESDRALPRVFLAGKVLVASDPTEALESARQVLTARAHRYARSAEGCPEGRPDPCFERVPPVVVEADKSPLPAAGPEGSRSGTVRWIRDDRDAVDVEVEVNAPRMLVLADTFAPGWTARVDGQEVPIYPAYHAFRAVPVMSPGKHVVSFEYRTPGLRVGGGLTLLFGIVTVGISLWGLRKSGSSAPGTTH